MGNEVFPLAKGFPTFSTIIKRSSTVKSLMCKETGLVGKIFSTMAAFKRPFPSVNFLVLSNTISLGAGIPNFVGLTRLFSSENSLILNKYVCVAASHLAFSPVLIAFVTVKNSFTLLTVVQFLPRITGLWLNHVKPYHVGLEVIHNLHVGREIPCCMDCPAFQKWGSHHIILKGFLSNVLLLVLLNVCRKIEFFPTCPTWVGFLCPICSFLFSQMQNVSQDWDTYLTGLGLFRGQNGPWGPNLWDSFCRFALFRRCLFILDSTPRTWKQTSDGEVLVNFLEGNEGKSLTLCNPMDCNLSGYSDHGIFQARLLECVAISFSRGSSWPRDRTQVSCTAGRRFTIWATREALKGMTPSHLYICHMKEAVYTIMFRTWNWNQIEKAPVLIKHRT